MEAAKVPLGVDLVWMRTRNLQRRDLHLLSRLLSKSELTRARKFHKPEDAASYVAAHALVRQYLGIKLKAAPQEIDFIRDINGKPQLLAADSTPPPKFTLSHAEGCAAAGFHLTEEVGVDVETFPDDPLEADFLLDSMTKEEVATLDKVSVHRLGKLIISLWACKEAVLKCIGIGLNASPNLVNVDLNLGHAVFTPKDGGPQRHFCLTTFQPTPAHVLAVAMEKPRIGKLVAHMRESSLQDFI